MFSKSSSQTLDWGLIDYRDAYDQQRELVDQRLRGEVGDTLVFAEHPPVFTIGRRHRAEEHIQWTLAECGRRGVEIVDSNRGGDVTFHGPGQIVGYPIIFLSAHGDLHQYLRDLEQVLINTLADFGVTGSRRDGLTGIWVGREKVAAIGVAVRRWVTYHGFALNVDPDLSFYEGIVPCGIDSTQGSVTSLSRLIPDTPTTGQVKACLARHFWRHFNPETSEPQ